MNTRLGHTITPLLMGGLVLSVGVMTGCATLPQDSLGQEQSEHIKHILQQTPEVFIDAEPDTAVAARHALRKIGIDSVDLQHSFFILRARTYDRTNRRVDPFCNDVYAWGWGRHWYDAQREPFCYRVYGPDSMNSHQTVWILETKNGDIVWRGQNSFRFEGIPYRNSQRLAQKLNNWVAEIE